jgi:hypothetical protein
MSLIGFVEQKSNMFVACVLVVIGVLFLPIILPNIFHGMHIAHIFLHIGGITMAVFLTVSTFYAYVKIRTTRLAITALAFSLFVASEIIKVIDVTWPYTFYVGSASLEYISHMFIIGMLATLSIGIFRKD